MISFYRFALISALLVWQKRKFLIFYCAKKSYKFTADICSCICRNRVFDARIEGKWLRSSRTRLWFISNSIFRILAAKSRRTSIRIRRNCGTHIRVHQIWTQWSCVQVKINFNQTAIRSESTTRLHFFFHFFCFLTHRCVSNGALEIVELVFKVVQEIISG